MNESNTEITEILEWSDKNFKAAITKIFNKKLQTHLKQIKLISLKEIETVSKQEIEIKKQVGILELNNTKTK